MYDSKEMICTSGNAHIVTSFFVIFCDVCKLSKDIPVIRKFGFCRASAVRSHCFCKLDIELLHRK
jgi:hypothetical protein